MTPSCRRTLILGTVLILACSGESTGPASGGVDPVARLAVQPETARLVALGDTVRLTARATTASGKPATVTVTWSSLDTQFGTVDGNGLVTAVAGGEARIVARAQGTSLVDTALVTVAQEVTTIVVTPERDTVEVGRTRQYVAAGRDRLSQPVASARFVWAASDTAVATVDSTGLVRGRARGAAEITVRADGATGTARAAVRNPRLTLDRDTALSGTVVLDQFELKAGRTIRLGGDLKLRVDGSVRIDGDLVGDCVAMEMAAAGSITVTGDLDTTCADSTRAGKPLRILGQGTLEFVDTEVRAGGEITIRNDSALALGSGPAFGLAAQSRAGPSCHFTKARVRFPRRAPDGADGGPTGAPGSDGQALTVTCGGDLVLDDADFFAQTGGHGGLAFGPSATGAIGGRGGDLRLASLTRIETRGLIQLSAGPGGPGGHAEAKNPAGPATARGGDAGRYGTMVVEAPVTEAVAGGGFLLTLKGEPGGSADATASDGDDAGAGPATFGFSAFAEGGDAADIGPSAGLALDGGIFRGLVRAPVSVAGRSGRGGGATVLAGRGGDGNLQFPRGADGGEAEAIAGDGGDINLSGGQSRQEFAGDAGWVIIDGGSGGHSVAQCNPNRPGASGGPGGQLRATPGQGGVTLGSGVAGSRGELIVKAFAGSGGNGGAGEPGGAGGLPGNDRLNRNFDDIRIDPTTLKPGPPGNACPPAPTATFTTVTTTLLSDPNNVRSRADLGQIAPPVPLTLLNNVAGQIEVRIDLPTPGKPVRGPVFPDDTFAAGGPGVFAGRQGFIELLGKLIRTAGAITGTQGVLRLVFPDGAATWEIDMGK